MTSCDSCSAEVSDTKYSVYFSVVQSQCPASQSQCLLIYKCCTAARNKWKHTFHTSLSSRQEDTCYLYYDYLSNIAGNST